MDYDLWKQGSFADKKTGQQRVQVTSITSKVLGQDQELPGIARSFWNSKAT